MSVSYVAAGTPSIVGVAKTKLYIGAAGILPASVTTWTEVGSVLALPKVGPTDSTIKVDTVGQSITLKLKGVTDPGGGALSLSSDFSDAGQTAVKLAYADKTNDYPFRYILPNPATTTGTGTMIDVMGKVMAEPYDFGSGPNNPVKAAVALEYTTLATVTAAT